MAYGAAYFLDQFLEPLAVSLTPEMARKILDLKPSPAARERARELAERASEGKLTEEEREEYDAYLDAIDIIGAFKAKARRAVAANSEQ